MMERDAFSKCHPAVNFLFFVGAIGFGMVFQHPAYLLAGAIAGACYYFLLRGRRALLTICGLVPFFLLVTFLNPLFNTLGEHVLFTVLGRPYTLEALLYGGAVAGIFVVILIWFGCYNAVMTGDKFLCLFGSKIPAVSLVLVMVLRMVPGFFRQIRKIAGARRSIGKGASAESKKRERVADGMVILSAMTSWALEGSVVTADSMRSRGYGAARRTSFQIYRLTATDFCLLILMLLLMAAVIVSAAFGGAEAVYTPALSLAKLSGGCGLGFAAYCGFLLIPTVLHLKEALTWRISRSKI